MNFKIFSALAAASCLLYANSVEIVKGVPYIEVDANGKTYRIEREQKPDSYLTNTFALTSRPSPPFFIEHIFDQIGAMTVTLNAVNNGCVTSYVIAAPIQVDGPISRFTVNNSGVACSGSPTITFSNMISVDAVSGTTLYTWDFGDGAVEVHPRGSGITHTYAAPGDYTVTVTGDNDAAPICSSTSSQVVKITVSTPNFNILQASPVCHETPIVFQDLSTTTANGQIVLWSWDFGDGTAQ